MTLSLDSSVAATPGAIFGGRMTIWRVGPPAAGTNWKIPVWVAVPAWDGLIAVIREIASQIPGVVDVHLREGATEGALELSGELLPVRVVLSVHDFVSSTIARVRQDQFQTLVKALEGFGVRTLGFVHSSSPQDLAQRIVGNCIYV